MSGLGTRWRRLPTGARAAIAAVGVLVLINVGLGLLDSATRGADRSGSRSSSFSTAANGTAGYADLLDRFGHPTSRARGEIRPRDLDPSDTVMLLDAGLPSAAERRTISEFTRSGGRVVAGGPDALEWTGPFRGAEIAWRSRGPANTRAQVDGDTYRVRTAGRGRWQGDGPRSLTRQEARPGTTIVLADTSPLQNRRLDEAENAAFGVALAGDATVRVVFTEGPHGFGSESGIDAIPGRWKVALIGGALAALLTLIAASRRLGPAEETARRLPPPRRAYVDAVGAALSRSRRSADAIAPLQAAAREHLARRAGLPADASPEEICAVAAHEGWSSEDITALIAPATDNESILAAGRALARAEKGPS